MRWGHNDENFLLNINQKIGELRQIVDLKSKIDCGLLVILPMNGSNLKNWIDKRVFEKTDVLEFHIYDRDETMKNIKVI